MPERPPSRRALAALAVAGALALSGGACSGDEGAATPTSTTSPSASTGPLEYTAFSDPSVPITVEVGRRFAIMLPADPADGWRWVVEPADSLVLAPLGSEFREDPTLLAQSTTTTTTAPPPPLPEGGLPPLPEVPTTEAPPTTEGPTTTTTAPGPLVQIVSYAGRTNGLAKITLRYERIGTSPDDVDQAETLVFDVLVGDVAIFTPPATDPPPG